MSIPRINHSLPTYFLRPKPDRRRAPLENAYCCNCLRLATVISRTDDQLHVRCEVCETVWSIADMSRVTPQT